ncbi:hypothetical protein COY29_00140 [Candidatus Woesebacteria bacterium CG_4_10_14_0_2_um_filter_39_14]|uniref:Uncharacterized protein n=3 Tax=Microgenomates group TaxID=1794810 RepID=A0A2M6YPE8_9BACT|nr:MAG: hypothetical protein COT04_02295 [Candidatus Shapirobacteria bacterium CG07_land_8_20_14_0_80_39_12]PIZ50270.1 MAG: hypothetical protein COY29_00140 [Candidatus Woesebacteria bacterium CG_4_10_14_0_2_um_filter_39_14]PJA49600.1 MAG: hypothetical protein CO169_01585 [Candidatus Shapirobacteria bacterium CG_4_9_14_3_um_filter_39_13]
MPKKKKTTRRKVKKIVKKDVKSIGLLIMALVLVVLAALFVAHLGQGKTSSSQTANQSGSVIVVPKGVLQCSKSFYEKTGGVYKVDATKYPQEDICQYYKTIKGDVEKTHNLQYNNEIVACRFFKENGETMIGETKYIHLGYEKKPCYQGMYQKP